MIRMSNPLLVLVDDAPFLYMEAMAIAERCRNRLEVLDASDPIRFNVEAMMEIALSEAAKQASFLPY